MRLSHVLLVLAIAAGTGCTSLNPYRTFKPPAEAECDLIDKEGNAPRACASLITEPTDAYDLHFVEFDDQGRLYPNHEVYGVASTQIDSFLDAVQRQVGDENSEQGASVVVFVHGWKHSAKADDPNLLDFRRVLRQLNSVEQAAFCKRRVIGLYVAWRGAGSKLGDPVEHTTFWSRKLAAENIATGSLQRLIAGLKALQAKTPQRSTVGARGLTEPDCSSRLKTTYVGHSFGGLVVLSSFSQDLMRRLMIDRAQLLNNPTLLWPDPDPIDEMVVAINPAIEAERFDALYHTALQVPYKRYRSPRLVVVTSIDDPATRVAFPFGRWINTATKHYPKHSGHARRSARTAVGHDPYYLTHQLTYWHQSSHAGEVPADPGLCERWNDESDVGERALIDVKTAQAFFAKTGGVFDANDSDFLPRLFCAKQSDQKVPGNTILVLEPSPGKAVNRNTPIWNVQTRGPIVRNHGDFANPRLVEFLRQLYVDSMFFRNECMTCPKSSVRYAPAPSE